MEGGGASPRPGGYAEWDIYTEADSSFPQTFSGTIPDMEHFIAAMTIGRDRYARITNLGPGTVMLQDPGQAPVSLGPGEHTAARAPTLHSDSPDTKIEVTMLVPAEE